MPTLTGNFDVALQAGLGAVNRVLAGQHRDVVPQPMHLHDLALRVDDTANSLRGYVEAQISTPTISIPAGGSSSAVTVHFDVRAKLTPDPGIREIDPIHGDVAITVDVVDVPAGHGGGSLIDMDLTGRSASVRFTPASGASLPAAEVDRINRVITAFLRGGFGSTGIAMPAPPPVSGGFTIRDLNLVMLPAAPAVALLWDMRTRTAPPRPAPADLTGLLRGPNDIALALSADFVRSTILGSIPAFPTSGDVHLDPPSVSLESGRIVLGVSGTASGAFFTSFRISASQAIRLDVSPPGGGPGANVVPAFDGAPRVDVTSTGAPWGGFFVDGIRDQVTTAILANRDSALATARAALASYLDLARLRTTLLNLRVPVSGLGFADAQIRPDGVVLHMALEVGSFPSPVVAFDIRPAGTGQVELNARRSWIPGGTIERMIWTDETGGSAQIDTRHHLSVTAPTSGVWGTSRWCLQVMGSQMRSGGATAHVESRACHVESGVLGRVRALDRALITLSYWDPGDPAPHPIADIDPRVSITSWGSSRVNILVHFASEVEEVNSLRDAIKATGTRAGALAGVVVVPRGTIGKLAADTARTGLSVTEDATGGWAKSFGRDKQAGSATYIVSPEGFLVWSKEGPPDHSAVSAALAEHAAKDGFVHREALTLSVQEGDKAPDFEFEFAQGHKVALRRFAGRAVQLLFWGSWSEPSGRELARLAKRNGGTALVVAVADGDDAQAAADAAKRHGFEGLVVPDPERQISQAYGIACWPTLVDVGVNGLVGSIRFGTAPARLQLDDEQPAEVPA